MPAEIQNQKVRGGPVKTSEKGISTTPKRQNYLKYIYLEEQENGHARACRINEQLGVTRSTVALTFRELRAEGFITYEPYSPIRLHCRSHRSALFGREALQPHGARAR